MMGMFNRISRELTKKSIPTHFRKGGRRWGRVGDDGLMGLSGILKDVPTPIPGVFTRRGRDIR
jgi:hypothetical protein